MRKLYLILLLFLSLVGFGQVDSVFTTVGSYSWVVPDSVTSIDVFAIQGGQGGGYKGGDGGNTGTLTGLVVIPGETLTIVVGAGGTAANAASGNLGGHSEIKRGMATIFSTSGTGGATVYSGSVGADGVSVSTPTGITYAGGGGAGANGYLGNGGNGDGYAADVSSGAGGGGKSGAGYYDGGSTWRGNLGYGGGGIGINGIGADGGAATTVGLGGSGGANSTPYNGGAYGGGGAGYTSGRWKTSPFNLVIYTGNDGAQGALSISYGTVIPPTPEDLPIPPTWQSTNYFYFGQLGAYSSIDLKTGLISCWELDEASGNAVDSYGSNDGTSRNITYQQTAPTNLVYAYGFNGSSSEVEVTATTALKLQSTAASWSMWINSDDVTSLLSLLTNRSSTSTGWQIKTGLSTLRIALFTSAGNYLFVTAPFTSTGVWKHIVVTYDGSTSYTGIKVYINGVDTTITDGSAGTFTGIGNSTENIGIGFSPYSNNEWVDGLIGQTRIYNTALTQSQVSALYNNGNGKSL